MPGEKVGDAYVEVHADADPLEKEIPEAVERGGKSGQKEADKQGKSIGDRLTKALTGPLSNSDKFIAKWAAILPSAGGALNLAAGAATALAGSLVQASAASASAVVVFGAVAQGALVAKLAFTGLGTAITATGKQQTAAMKKLSPAAQDVVKSVDGLKKSWTGLQKSVQQAVFKGLADDVTRVGKTLLPVLRTNLDATGKALNGVITSISRFATSSKFVKDFGTILKGNTSIFKTLGQAAVPILRSIMNLWVVLLPFGKQLAGIIVQAAKAFERWTAAGRKSGSIADFMTRAFNSAKLLWPLLKNVATALGNILGASAPNGDSLIKNLDAITAKFAAWTGSVKGKSAIAGWSKQGTDALGQIATVIGKLMPIFKSLADPKLFQAEVTVLDSVATSLQKIEPILTPLLTLMANFLTKTSGVSGPLIAVALAMKGLQTASRLVGIALSPLTKAWELIPQAAKDSAAKQAVAMGKVVLSWAKAGVKIAAQAAIQVAKWVWVGVQATISAVKQAAAWVVANGPAMIAAVGEFAATVATTVAGWAFMALQATINAVKIAAAWLIALGPVGWAIAALVALGAAFVVLWTKSATFRDIVTGAFNAVKNAAISVFDWVKANWPTLLAIITGPIGIAVLLIVRNWDTIKNATIAAWNAIKAAVSAALNGIKAVVSTVFNGVKAVATAVWNGIKAVVNTAVAGIKAEIRGLAAIAGWISGWFNSAKSAASNALSGLLGVVRGIPGKVKSALSGLGGVLTGAGKDIVQGLINGIGSMGGALSSALVGLLPGPLKKFAGKIGLGSPSKLFHQYGVWIVTGLANGIKASAPSATAALNKLAADLKKAGEKHAQTIAATYTKRITALDKQLTSLKSALVAGNDQLATEVDNYNQTMSGLFSQLDDSGTFGNQATKTFDDIVSSLTSAVTQTQEFADTLATLKTEGLNSTLLTQISNAGLSALDAAKALAAAGPAGVAQVNALQGQLDSSATAAGDTLADSLYGASVKSAQVYVDTLTKGIAKVNASIAAQAKALTAAITKAVNKTKSGITIKKHAAGSKDYPGGIGIFGEAGPELAVPPPHTRIFPADETKRILAGLPPQPGMSGLGSGQPAVSSSVTTVQVAMSVSIDDLAKLSKIDDFLNMLGQARVVARKTQRSGTVSA